jgi:hypothetical protein
LTADFQRAKVGAMSKAPQVRILDESKLLQLTPPLSVYVVKKYFSNRTTPLQLPPAKMDPQYAPGQGYDHADVKGIASLLAKVPGGGGGSYVVQVTDVQGARVEFDVWLDPQSIPDLMPEGAQLSAQPQQQFARPPAAVIPFAPPPPVNGAPAAPADWFGLAPQGVPRMQAPPPSTIMGPQYYPQQQPAQQQHANPWGQPPPWQQAPSYGGYGREPDRDERRRDRDDERDKELQRLREEGIKRDAQHAMERQGEAHRQQLAELREELRRMSERPQQDPEVAQLRDMVREQREENRRLMDKLEALSRDKGPSDTMVMMMNQQQQMMSTLLPLLLKKDDNTSPMIIESMRQQADSMKEMFRVLSDQMRDRERNAMTAKDALDMAEKLRATSGADILLKNLADGYGGVMNLMKTAIDLQQQAGGREEGPVAGIIRDGIQKAGEVAEKIVQARRDVGVSEARAREIEATVHARAAAGLPAGPPPGVAGPAPGQGFAPPPPVVQRPAAPAVAGAPGAVPADEETVRRFGQLAESVMRLRLGVKDGKISPGQAWQGVGQALPVVQERGWDVPALKLLEQQQFAEFVDALVPDADHAWKRELMRWLYKGGDPGPVAAPVAPVHAPANQQAAAGPPFAQPPAPGPGPDDGDDDDDGDDGGEEEDEDTAA